MAIKEIFSGYGNYKMNKLISDILSIFKITNQKCINTLLLYIAVVFLIFITCSILKIIIYSLTEMLEKALGSLTRKILKGDTKIIEYSVGTVWLIKFNADINYYLKWLNYTVFKTYTVVTYSNNTRSVAEIVKSFSLQNILQCFVSFVKYIFCIKTTHIIIAGTVIYLSYKKEIEELWSKILSILTSISMLGIKDILDICELIIIIFTAFFIILDFRHKINGYTTIREDRFKELILMEEKVLHLMQRMSYGLESNIDTLVQTKNLILTDGATALLSGKECSISGGHLKIYDSNFSNHFNRESESIINQFADMDEEFNELNQLNEEFKKSSLYHSNIYLIDHQAMLTELLNFWNLGENRNHDFKRMLFLCRGSRKEWFENWFIKQADENNKNHFNFGIDDIEKQIISASDILDSELQEAFEYELTLERYRKKIFKRIKGINSFSKYSFMK
jgi:hypothetical protein